MGREPTIAKGNIYYEARVSASKKNKFCSNREDAALLININKCRIFNIESGKADAYPEEVIKMAEVYEAPYLIGHYCKNVCPIGKKYGCNFSLEDDSNMCNTSIMLVNSLNKANNTKDVLLKILEGGKINDDEIEMADEAITALAKITKDAINLRIEIEKAKRNMKR